MITMQPSSSHLLRRTQNAFECVGRGSGIAARAAGCSALLLAIAAVTAFAQDVDKSLWATDGDVYAVARDGGTLYIGGKFTQIGPSTGCAALFDAVTGAVQQPYLDVIASPYVGVFAVASDGSGGWYLGGNFRAVQGEPRHGLAHVDASGKVTAWNANVGTSELDKIKAIAVSGDRVYVGGSFADVNAPYYGLVAIDRTSGTIIAGGLPLLESAGSVNALALSGSTLYIGGKFVAVDGQTRNLLAAVDAATGALLPWNPNVTGPSPNFSAVHALAVSGGMVYAGGYFDHVGGIIRFNVAAIDAATGLATEWNAAAASDVYSLAVAGGVVYAGGAFNWIGGYTRNQLAALDINTGLATGWDPNANGWVQCIAVSGGMVYVGGRFTAIGGQPRNAAAALDPTTAAATSWDPRVPWDNVETPQGVTAIEVIGGKVMAAGTFNTAGGEFRRNLAAIDLATGAVTSWNPNLVGNSQTQYPQTPVYTLAVGNGALYVGGAFSSVGGQSRRNLAALDVATGAATSWDPQPDNQVRVLVLKAGTLYVGGTFVTVSGQPRHYAASFDATTGALREWNPNMGNAVVAIALGENTAYLGGSFLSAGGQPRNRIASVDLETGAVTSWNPNANGFVSALALDGGTLFACGNFSSIGGQTRSALAALDVGTGAATSWNPGVTGVVDELALDGTTLYVGGGFTEVRGQRRHNLAAVNTVTGALTSWDPDMDQAVYSLVASPDRVFTGGLFYSVDDLPRSGLCGFGGSSTVSVDKLSATEASRLTGVAPNPSRDDVRIQYVVARPGPVRLDIVDVSGRRVETLINALQPAGRYAAVWNGKGPRGRVSPGLYFVRLAAPDVECVRRIATIR